MRSQKKLIGVALVGTILFVALVLGISLPKRTSNSLSNQDEIQQNEANQKEIHHNGIQQNTKDNITIVFPGEEDVPGEVNLEEIADKINNEEDKDAQAGDTRPNIIVMQPDDFPFFAEWTPPPKNPRFPIELAGLPGDSQRRTFAEGFPNNYAMPHLERLRAQGLQMMQAYTASSMCSTSRFTTITGRYSSRSGFNRKDNGDQPWVSRVTVGNTKLHDMEGQTNDCSEDNMAALLKKHGYRTGMVGKWHLSDIEKETYTYQSSQKQIQECGFDYVDGLYIENFNFFNTKNFSHNNEWVTSKAVEFIQDYSNTEQPFFLYFNPTVPHPFGNVAEALQNFSCKDTPSGILDEEPIVPNMNAGFTNCKAYRDTIFQRAGGSTSSHDLGAIWIDDSVGAIIHALEQINQLHNTIFLFQIDHGVEAKSTHWENGNRIAQFIHYPKEFGTRGMKITLPVSTIDIAPTLFDYAAIPKQNQYQMDGISWRYYHRYTTTQLKQSPGFFNEPLTPSTDILDARCLLGELRKNRSLVCGKCHKLIVLYEEGKTETMGYYAGFDTDRNKMYFNLCSEAGNYVDYPEWSTESNNLAFAYWDVFTAMKDVLNCILIKTSPQNPPDFSISSCSFRAALDVHRGITVPPAIVPTPSPTIPCNDQSSFIVPGIGMRTCKWVRQRKDVRCYSYAVQCPVTCDWCPVNFTSQTFNHKN